MELSLTLLNQVIVMFLLIIIGYATFKLKFVNDIGSNQLTNILLYFVSPLVVINAYQIPYNDKFAHNLVLAFILGVTSHIIAIGVAYIFIRKKGNEKRYAIERFAIIYSNCGFMALPLVSALFGSEGVFYASAYMAVFQVLSWTHGYVMMSGKTDRQTIIKSIFSPVVMSVAAGLLIFFLKIKLPAVISTTVGYMASLNTPLAMLVTGISLAQTDILSAFKRLRCYYVMFLSCLAVPTIAMLLYLFLPIDNTIILVNLVSTACPCAVLTLLFSSKFELDTKHASQILTLSNVTCVVTLPIVVFLFQFLSSYIN